MCDDDPDILPDSKCEEHACQQLRDINWIVANCSTPANLFHILRRQVMLPFRKPLIIATPKSLLRLAQCRSPFSDMNEGTQFQTIIPDTTAGKNVKKVVFCSGKTYYDLLETRKARGKDNDVALIRIEQVHIEIVVFTVCNNM